MRIAFIAPYQGSILCQHRPITSNFGLGATAKMRILAELLRHSSHDIEIFSQGEVIESKLTYYPRLSESATAAGDIPVRYASAVPLRGVNALWSTRSLLRLFKAHHRRQPYDMVVIYNLKPPQVTCANYALARGLPVVMEYEDDQFLEIWEPNFSRLTSNIWEKQARQLLPRVSGCVAGSADLLAQVGDVPKLLLPGVIDRAIISAGGANERRNWVVFSGTHSRYQGLSALITSWRRTPPAGWELHIAGHGEETATLHALAAGHPTIVFHGVLDREANARLLTQGRISVVAYEVEKTRGFSFKTLECLGAGLHVITTRLTALSALDPELKQGLTYLDGNDPDTISSCLHTVIADRLYERTSRDAVLARYGPDAVQRSLNAFLLSIRHAHAAQFGHARPALT
jgi:hypothetical protein